MTTDDLKDALALARRIVERGAVADTNGDILLASALLAAQATNEELRAETRCANAEHSEEWGCPCFDAGTKVPPDHEACVAEQGALITQIRNLEGMFASRDQAAQAAQARLTDLSAENERLRQRIHEAVDEAQRRGAKTESELSRLRGLMKDGWEYVKKHGAPHHMADGTPTASQYELGGIAALWEERDAAQSRLTRIEEALRQIHDKVVKAANGDPDPRYAWMAVGYVVDVAQRALDNAGSVNEPLARTPSTPEEK